jgi:hypothetical protein
MHHFSIRDMVDAVLAREWGDDRACGARLPTGSAFAMLRRFTLGRFALRHWNGSHGSLSRRSS